MVSNQKKSIICVSSTEESLDSEIEPRFGRCKCFIIIEIEDKRVTRVYPVKNVGAEQDRGAGISAAEQIGKLGTNILITGDVGPKARDVLDQLGIKIYRKSGIARVAVSEYLNNDMPESDKSVSNINSENKEKTQEIKNQRIFIPLMENNGEDSEISLHFGHAPYFGLYDIESKKLIIKENKLDHNDPRKTPVDQVIEAVNPTVVYAQDMGGRAVNLFTQKNISLKTGSYKTAKEVIENLDNLADLSKDCGH